MSNLVRLVLICSSDYARLERDICALMEDADLQVLVVGDGACATVERLRRLEDFRPNDSPRVQPLELPNLAEGGAALLAAVACSAEQGFTHIVTTDASCRQLQSEVKCLAAVVEAYPLDVVGVARHSFTTSDDRTNASVGRLLRGALGPNASSLLQIARTSMRIYPLIHVQGIPTLTGPFDGETELLIRLLWKGVAIRVVDSDTDESERSRRRSRYQQLKYEIRAGTSTVLLVTASLLGTHHTPADLSSSLGVGVFIGCTPFLGFHTLLAIVISYLCGLNVAYVWFGTQISNPLLAAFLAVLSVRVGRYVTGTSASTLGALSLEWLVGSAVVGGILAVFAGITSYYVARRLSRQT